MGEKTLWAKEKLLVTSNFSFSHSVFERLVLQTRKNQGLFGKGLKHCGMRRVFLFFPIIFSIILSKIRSFGPHFIGQLHMLKIGTILLKIGTIFILLLLLLLLLSSSSGVVLKQNSPEIPPVSVIAIYIYCPIKYVPPPFVD